MDEPWNAGEGLSGRAAAVMFVIVALGIIDLACGHTEWDSHVTIASDTKTQSFATGRYKRIVTLVVKGDYESGTGLFQWRNARQWKDEVRADIAGSLEGRRLQSLDELKKLQGRSNLGKAWDWLKKPR